MKSNQPFFSVVIPCYNYGQYLDASIGSAIIQTYKNFEIIFVNDGSTDNSMEVAQRIKKNNPNVAITLIDQPNSGQPAISRNNGIKIAQGEIILCLDADDIIDQHMLSKCAEIFSSHSEVELVYTDAIFFDDSSSEYKQSGIFNLEVIAVNNQIFCCSAFKKTTWEKVGGYKTNVKGYEDWDLWIAMAEHGVNAMKIAEPLFYYRTGKDGLFVDAENRDLTLKANIVENHPNLYSQETKVWAKNFLSQHG